jgi:NADH-quinone oxidoreductase subunit N
MLFYIVIYGVMNLGVFAVLSMIEVRGRAAEELSDLAGLARRQPLTALAMAVCLFSLMGMPPTAGFFGKVYIFSSALAAGPHHPHQKALMILAVIGVLNAAVAAAYYLRIVAACYLGDEEAESTVVPHSSGVRWALVGCCTVILFIGLWPESLIRMARQPFYHLKPASTMVQLSSASPPRNELPASH